MLPVADKTKQWIDKAAAKLPPEFEAYPDADPAREKALSDSVRAGVVDDVGVEEQRKLYEPKLRQV